MKIWKRLFHNHYPILILSALVLIFFYPFFLNGKIPIPADTIVGMYHPWRDAVWDGLTAGVPYKNYLITDPVRQQYVWRKLAIDNLKKGYLPLWNPYSFSGTPLLANFQSAVFYPLNLMYFLFPFNLVWSIQVILQPLLGGIFLYLYLREIKVSKMGSLLGSIAFSFSGFSIAWMEWNTVIQTAIWLPLILLAKEHLLQKISKKWSLILIFSEISLFFAGHLQTFFYAFIISNFYLIARFFQIKKEKNLLKEYLPFLLIGIIVITVTSIQWIPTAQFILNSARDADQSGFLKDGWFIPWQNLIQFLVPDFFGNPATNNYWGVWNYGEFIGFVGFIPIVLALYAIMFIKDKKILFWEIVLFSSLIFALPTPLARIPYILKIPFISTSQPTRLIYLVDLSLSILFAFGFESFIKEKNWKKIAGILIPTGITYLSLWLFVLKPQQFFSALNPEFLSIARRNLILPTIYFMISLLFLFFLIKARGKLVYFGNIVLILIIFSELSRFGWKFISFSTPEYIFPATKITLYLQGNAGNDRIMSLDRRIMPANFSGYYHLQDVSGYDPLYLKKYNLLVGAWNRGKPDLIDSSFNRIVTPTDFKSAIAGLLGVKLILSYGQLEDTDLPLIMREGQTYLYDNYSNMFPRAFFVDGVVNAKDQGEELKLLYEMGKDQWKRLAVSSEEIPVKSTGRSVIPVSIVEKYRDNYIKVYTKSDQEKLLVLSEIYYPSWRVYVDGIETKLYEVDFALRGVVVPKGEHTVEFSISLI